MKPSKAVEEMVKDFYSISPKHRTKERLVKELTTLEARVREEFVNKIKKHAQDVEWDERALKNVIDLLSQEERK